MLRAEIANQRQRKDSGLFPVVHSMTKTYCLQLFSIQDHHRKVLSPLSQTVKMYLGTFMLLRFLSLVYLKQHNEAHWCIYFAALPRVMLSLYLP